LFRHNIENNKIFLRMNYFCKTINGQKSDLFSVYAEIEMRTEKQKILAIYLFFSLCLPEYIFVNF